MNHRHNIAVSGVYASRTKVSEPGNVFVSSILSALCVDGCLRTPIVDHGRAGAHSHHAPTFTARMRRDIARRAAALTLTSPD